MTPEELTITAIVAGAIVTFGGIFLKYALDNRQKKPLLDVRVSRKEARFEARLEVQNLNETNYTYKIKVAGKFLQWEKSKKETISLAPGTASGVILDEVISQLEDHPIIIEALNWRPFPWSKNVFKRLFKEI